MKSVDRVERAVLARSFGSRLAALLPARPTIDVFEVTAEALLLPQRFDVAIKAGHAQALLFGGDLGFSRRHYIEHMRAFNGLVEADGSGKLGADRFVSEFEELVRDVSQQGLRPDCVLPISQDGVILDGAHRLAACLMSGQPVRVAITSVEVGPRFDADFFRDRGMSESGINFAVTKYVELDTSARMAIYWPAATGSAHERREILSRHGAIVAESSVQLQGDGPAHVTRLAYAGEEWLGSDADDFAGARNKSRHCFASNGPVRMAVLTQGRDLIECKEEIRALFPIGKHSVHITDTHAETLVLTRALFNRNTIQFMNVAPLRRPRWFRHLFGRYQQRLTELPPREQLDYCLDGSAVLAVYGIRDVRDLDYLYGGPHQSRMIETSEIALHNHDADRYPQSILEIVHDPAHHFYVDGCKMVAPAILRAMKQLRDEPKDRDDVAGLTAILAGQSPRLPRATQIRLALRPHRIRGRLKSWALRARYLMRVAIRVLRPPK